MINRRPARCSPSHARSLSSAPEPSPSLLRPPSEPPQTMSSSAPPPVVSAPGKVLLAGGYLVLDPAYSGLVVATSARFYTVVRPGSASTAAPAIRVRSPQFVDATWTYQYGLDTASDPARVSVAQVDAYVPLPCPSIGHPVM